VAVLLALYPTALSVGWVLRTVAPDLPFAVSMLIANIVGVAALTWLLMPLVTKALAPWLSR
jgi:antibiotic biosynthesis monooxygenase (ABM) superfamily enzyme